MVRYNRFSKSQVLIVSRPGYHYAAATRSIPFYRYVPTEVGHPNPPIPEQLLFDAVKDIPYGLALINKHGHSLYHIFRRLHIITVALEPPWDATNTSDVDIRFAMSNLVFEAEYDLIMLSYQLKADTSAPLLGRVGLLDVCDSLCAAAQILIFSGIRMMPLAARFVDLQMVRLSRALHSEELIENWKSYASAESLLWTLAVTAVAANGRAEYIPAVALLRRLCAALQIIDVEDMVSRLKCFVWSSDYDKLGRSVLNDLFQQTAFSFSRDEDHNYFQDIDEGRLLLSQNYDRY